MMMSRLIRLILIAISIYMVVFIFLFGYFLHEHPFLQGGTSIVIYLIIFTLSLILLTILFDRDISKYIAIPLYGILVFGLRAFYYIFIYISDLPLMLNEPKYGFEYYIYHTFFTETTFKTYKVTEAKVFIFMVLATIIISMGVYLKYQKGSMKDNYLSE